jgi:RNA polymerase sigma-70 factor (ECF subfamily)
MNESDQNIIGRILAGNPQGYAVLLRRYRDKVMTLAKRMLGSEDDAEEAAQDAFIRAFRSLHAFEHRAQFSTWLYRITYNVCLTRLSRRRNELPLADTDDALVVADENGRADASTDAEELREAVAKAIGHLRPEYASVITLFYLHEQTHEEIAVITGLPIGTIKNRLHRARNELQRLLRRLAQETRLIHS